MEEQKQLTDVVTPAPAAPKDKLISLKELADMTGLSYRSILQARTSGRFLLDEVRPSPGVIRVRLSDADAVLRGEKQVMSGAAFDPKKKERLRVLKSAASKAKKRAKGGVA